MKIFFTKGQNMQGIYILPQVAFGDSLKFLPKALMSNFAKIGLLEILGEKGIFSESEILKLLSDSKESEVLKSIISKFNEISAQNDFVIVNGVQNLPFVDCLSLNAKIANTLNLGILSVCESEISAKILGEILKEKKSNDFAKIYAKNCDFGGAKFEISQIESNPEILISKINANAVNIVTPISFEAKLYEMAKNNIKRVVLPESNDDRILKAADIILKSKAVQITLLGEKEQVLSRAKELNLNLSDAEIIDPKNNEFLGEFANVLYELRKAKGMELEKAQKLVQDRTYFGTMLVYSGKCDAMVSGASTTTAETIRPALQIIKMKPGVATVSGSFLMCLDTEVVVFADCAITPNPTFEQLAGIAISSADTAKAFGIEPKVAMLSYSTGASGSGEDVDFVVNATAKVRELAPNLNVDGPLQFDAAIDKVVAKKKMPDSKVAGSANVFIYPNLNCGNICYKAVQRTSGAVAIGPILQGLKKPVNDLSRGCLVEDVVNTILISAIQAGGK